MRKRAIRSILLGLLLIFGLGGCAPRAAEETSAPATEPAATSEAPRAQSPVTEPYSGAAFPPQTGGERGDRIIDTDALEAITGVGGYQYTGLEGDVTGGRFWSVTSAMLTVEFRIHPGGGMDLFEDYRTAANPQSRIWLESPLWDTAIYYDLGDWDAETIALCGEDCYAVGFVPSAYAAWSAPELGAALMELLITSAPG